MSCYLRHMKDILDEAGIEVTSRNKKQIDIVIHSIVDVNYKECSATWEKLKSEIIDNDERRRSFIKSLQDGLK